MLLDSLTVTLAESLQRKASTTPSRWGENYVVMGKPLPGPFRLKYHPWSRPWLDLNEDWVGKKGAQMGMTLACLIRSIFTIDILRNDVLYILPKKNPDATDFSRSKFDPLIESSPHLQQLFSSVRNVGHKQAGSVNLFIRGSRSRSALKSISVGLRIYDEFDEMNQKNIALADERSSGYRESDTQNIKISTPTLPDYGITKAFDETDQQHYFFKCPHCSRYTELLPNESLIILTDDSSDKVGLQKSYLICKECKHPLSDNKQSWLNEQNCMWNPTANEGKASLHGFWIPQLYSMTKPLWKMARQVIKGRTDPIENKELHNSVYAQEHVAEGARATADAIASCKANYKNRSSPKSKIVTMGVDVGHKELFCHIDEWLLPPTVGASINNFAIPRSLAIIKVSNFQDLYSLMYTYQILHAMVDVDPVYRDAVDFANQFPGSVHLCRFVATTKRKDITPEAGAELVIQVNRTIWLDISQARYLNKKIILPYDYPEDYEKMVSALIREEYYNKEGNPAARFVSVGADHWALARVYSEIALPFAVSRNEGQDIKAFL